MSPSNRRGGWHPIVSQLDDYLARTPRSAELFRRATASLPGGSTRTTVFAPPYPPYIAAGEGIRIRDIDDNVYRDFLGNYTALILGHAHPAVVAAVEDQVRRGSAFGAPTEVEVELAQEIRRRLPSIERIRFTSSGTEATMFAIRIARAFTGRDVVARFERHYHGTHDTAMAGSRGVPAAVGDLVVELPWDDAAGVERALAGREGQVATVIIEPVQGAGGIRVADASFLAFLRAWCTRNGALLIFDEVISFRVGPGGTQELLGVRPDLTTLGKIIGGGYPLAAFGGRADVMDLFDARREGALTHGGTYNGNPVAAAAGLATLRELTPERFEQLAGLGDRLRGRLAEGITAGALAAHVEGVASLFQIHAGEALSATATGAPAAGLWLGLLLEGFYLAPRGMGAIAVPTTSGDVDELAEATLRVLASLQPVTA
jgi:glutamate-1-semialdehyde 2,1-aminomutase